MKPYSLSCVLVSLMMLSGCTAVEPDVFDGEDIIPIGYDTFSLHDHEGYTYGSENWSESVTVVQFMLTNCWDVCPTQTQGLSALYEEFSDYIGKDLEFVSITVDPWRDDQVALTGYMTAFNTSWPMVTVPFLNDENLSVIEQVWNDFGITVTLLESNNSTSVQGRGHTVYYNVEHTDGIVLVDREGMQRVRWTSDDWDLNGIRNDINALLNGI
jgi:cytochrome oxidase Cu insertion factor (SCO1/SenC/PrrC family)